MSHFMQYYNYTFTHKCGTHIDLISIINQESLFYKKKNLKKLTFYLLYWNKWSSWHRAARDIRFTFY